MSHASVATFDLDSARLVPDFSRRWVAGMNVPDELRKCVLFLGTKTDGRFVPRATAFLVAYEEHGIRTGFLVTAQHVVSGILQKGDVWVRENLKNGTAHETRMLPDYWHYHPNEPRESDVAVCIVNFGDDSDVHAIPLNGPKGILATRDIMQQLNAGLGDEVVIVGLFRTHFGVDHNTPIIRIGNISAIQDEPVKTRYCGYIDAHLIEARSLAALSGSPVFLVIPPVRLKKVETGIPGWHLRQTQFTSGQAIFLLGLVHGHFDAEGLDYDVVSEDATYGSGINTGIAVVVPVEKIIETINEPEWADMRKRAIKSGGAVADASISETGGEDVNPFHKEGFTSLLNAAAKTKPQGDQT
jgi:hypothetical protein